MRTTLHQGIYRDNPAFQITAVLGISCESREFIFIGVEDRLRGVGWKRGELIFGVGVGIDEGGGAGEGDEQAP